MGIYALQRSCFGYALNLFFFSTHSFQDLLKKVSLLIQRAVTLWRDRFVNIREHDRAFQRTVEGVINFFGQYMQAIQQVADTRKP